MTIRIKRVYAPPASDDGIRILVDRLWPRGLSSGRRQVISPFGMELHRRASIWLPGSAVEGIRFDMARTPPQRGPSAGTAARSKRPRAAPPVTQIASAIHMVRGQRVMLDADLAALYGVSTKRLNEQVRRNRARFPEDFAFRLTADEVGRLRSQIATSKTGRGGRRNMPMAFTEHGTVMLASEL